MEVGDVGQCSATFPVPVAYSILAGWRRRHPAAFFSFLICSCVTAVGDLMLWGFIVGGESRAHDIASWLTPLTPLPEVAKAITGT